MTTAAKRAALQAVLMVATRQASLSVADIAFALQRDYGFALETAQGAAQEIKVRSLATTKIVRREIRELKRGTN